MATKAVRFTQEEEKDIQVFLQENSFLDFSTLARLAIKKFIENPELEFKPIKPKSKNQEQKNGRVTN